MKTREEVEKLKAEWYSDPGWDIENTEGFEEYAAELEQYSMRCKFEWEQQRNKALLAKAEFLGVPGNIALAQYVSNLEYKIKELEDLLYKHIDRE